MCVLLSGIHGQACDPVGETLVVWSFYTFYFVRHPLPVSGTFYILFISWFSKNNRCRHPLCSEKFWWLPDLIYHMYLSHTVSLFCLSWVRSAKSKQSPRFCTKSIFLWTELYQNCVSPYPLGQKGFSPERESEESKGKEEEEEGFYFIWQIFIFSQNFILKLS